MEPTRDSRLRPDRAQVYPRVWLKRPLDDADEQEVAELMQRGPAEYGCDVLERRDVGFYDTDDGTVQFIMHPTRPDDV
ncbi:MAG: hypothetical protein M3457_02185 [Chloroflexota bacterium]|nr:hypothetical protein [Chloroflexota bacterium]